jgi:hypothetical protein
MLGGNINFGLNSLCDDPKGKVEERSLGHAKKAIH